MSEVEPDFETRKAEFMAEYGVLVNKYKLDTIHVPVWTPNENGTWEMRVVPQFFDTTDQPVKSPFIA